MEGSVLQLDTENININYLAGLIDGEGFFTINYREHKQSKSGISFTFTPVVGVHMTSVKLLEDVKKQYGGNLYKRKGTNLIRADWSIRQAANVYPFLKNLKPYLKVKVEQAELLINFCKRFKFYTGKKYSKLSEEEIKMRRKVKLKLTKLNKRQT